HCLTAAVHRAKTWFTSARSKHDGVSQALGSRGMISRSSGSRVSGLLTTALERSSTTSDRLPKANVETPFRWLNNLVNRIVWKRCRLGSLEKPAENRSSDWVRRLRSKGSDGSTGGQRRKRAPP